MSLQDSPSTGCRVLVADDDRDHADSLVDMLRAWGFSAQAVYDGDEAILADELLQPRLVLMDIRMPRLDGYAAATMIRQSSPARQVRLVALTGSDSDVAPDLSASVGFDDFITKPIGRARLHLLALEAR